MTTTDKARREEILIGSLGVEGFQMPNGEYRMSLTSTAEAVGLGVQNASDFLRSNAAKRLLGEGYTAQISVVEVDDSQTQGRGQTRIRAIPLAVVAKYWLWQSSRGNKQAFALVNALLEESLDRRFDAAFGVSRSEAEYNQHLAARLEEMERSFSALSDAYAEPDILREHVSRLEQQLRDNGIEPWQLPPYEE